MTAPRMRAGTTDRQGAVDRLTRHFTDGRLDPDEFDDRMGKAYNATYLDEFPALFIDLPKDEQARSLPVGSSPDRSWQWSAAGGQDRPIRPRGPSRNGSPRGVIAVAVVAALFWVGVLTHALFLLPLIWLALVFSVGRHRRRQWQSDYRQRSEHWQRSEPWQRPGSWERRDHWQCR